jgi:hypothetical protein
VYKPDSSTASYIDFAAALEEDFSFLLDEDDLLDDVTASLEDVSICLLLEETFLLLDDDASFFDEDDFSFSLDEDDLLDDVSSISSDSSSEIVGVEHATREAANRKAREIFKVFIP